MRAFHPVTWIPIAMLASSVACGTLLYPERRHMENDRVDPIVILMDGGLLFVFIIPGVIAFAVDIATGAIYEPAGREWALRGDDTPLELTVTQAGVLELRLPPAAGVRPEDGIWWESSRGDRIPTRVTTTDAPGLYRLESRIPLEPGLHRLVVAGTDGREVGVPITVL